MESDLLDFLVQPKDLITTNRPLRLRLDCSTRLSDDMLLPQRVYGTESICGGLEYRILCVSARAQLPLKEFIGLPAALDFVTDRGELRSVCGIVTEQPPATATAPASRIKLVESSYKNHRAMRSTLFSLVWIIQTMKWCACD